MRTKLFFLSLVSVFFLTSCVSYDLARPEIQQGNRLSQKKISRLKVGMSKQEVENLLGSSLLNASDEEERWDYAYREQKRNKIIKNKELSLYFSHGKLEKIQTA